MWFKVDDKLPFHPKVIAAENEAMGVWVRTGSWCGAHLTDGYVPAHLLAAMDVPSRLTDRLVSAGLWLPAPGGFRFHDWASFQPTREDVEKQRNAAAARARKWRERKGVEL